MIWPVKTREKTNDAQAAVRQSEVSRTLAEKHRAESLRLRAAAEHAEVELRRHNSANGYAEWLQQVMRGKP